MTIYQESAKFRGGVKASESEMGVGVEPRLPAAPTARRPFPQAVPLEI